MMRGNKYGNKICYYKGIKFQSKKERDYYIYLHEELERKGVIRNLRLQVSYELVPGVFEDKVKQYKRKPDVVYRKCIQEPICYVADFVYEDPATGKDVVVDTKSEATKKNAVYILKKKMMKALLGIEILEK